MPAEAAHTPVLSAAEQRVDQRLAALKAEFLADCEGSLPFDMRTLNDARIWRSGLYRFCTELPKGADLHVHGLACMPVDPMVAWLREQPDVYIFTGEMPQRGSIRHFTGSVPPGYKLFARALEDGDITEDELHRIWTLLGQEPRQNVWVWFETIFDRHAFATDCEIVRRYYEAVFRYYLSIGVNHIEIKILLFGSPEEAATQMQAVRAAYYTVMDEAPDLVVRVAGAGLKYRWIDRAVTDAMLDNAVFVHDTVKDDRRGEDFLVSLDLVNEEERSNDIAFYGDKLRACLEGRPGLKLRLHCGETLRPESTSIAEALALGTDRIGHGYILYKHPDLLEEVRRRRTCLEVCPISNRLLGYVDDLRRHPARGYFRGGIPIVLASDDPAFQEHTSLVDDFFAATMCWDLSLADIKQLVLNSLQYSSLGPGARAAALEGWQRRWNAFIEAWA